MSNAKKRQNDGLVTLAELQAEAEGSDKGPFRFQVAVDDVIEFQRPDVDAILDLEEFMREGKSREFLEALAGDQYDRLMKAIGGEHHKVVSGFAERIQKHFALGE